MEKGKFLETLKSEAQRLGVGYSSCVYKPLVKENCVLVKIPERDAKYMRVVSKHTVLMPQENLKEAIILEVSSHYLHGDFPHRLPDGCIKPSVMRHFFVSADDCGKRLVCTVDLQTKTDLLSGEEVIIVNVFPEKNKDPKKVLCLGISSGQVKIPGTEKFIGFKDF